MAVFAVSGFRRDPAAVFADPALPRGGRLDGVLFRHIVVAVIGSLPLGRALSIGSRSVGSRRRDRLSRLGVFLIALG